MSLDYTELHWNALYDHVASTRDETVNCNAGNFIVTYTVPINAYCLRPSVYLSRPIVPWDYTGLHRNVHVYCVGPTVQSVSVPSRCTMGLHRTLNYSEDGASCRSFQLS